MSDKAANYLPQVREQYEELPYPPRDPREEMTRTVFPHNARLDAVNHFCFKGQQDFKNFRVLIAGGGTGDACIAWAEQLRGKQGSEVVYLDMSAASRAVAESRAKIRGLDNITWVTDSLLNVAALGLGQFDFIDCCGVLHHLISPDDGLKALKSVLKPQGAISVMVYATYGRASVYMMQDMMRIFNECEASTRQKIDNTRALLSNLPPYNLFKLMKTTGLWDHTSSENDSELFDLFLHTQDRAYTILEAHDWLRRCGMKMAGEPGAANTQHDYVPESFIKDPAILAKAKALPIEKQQALAELMSTQIKRHEFFVVHDNAADTEASVDDESLVPYIGMRRQLSYNDLANAAAQKQGADFTITFKTGEKMPVPGGKHVPALLRQMDGQRTIGEIYAAVKDVPAAELKKDFEKLIASFKRAYVVFLRAKDVPPFKGMIEIQQDMLARRK